MEPTGSPETSVPSHVTLRSNPEDERIHFNRSESLRLRGRELAAYIYIAF